MLRYGIYFLLAAIVLLGLAYLTRTYYWDGVLFSLNIEAVQHGQMPFTALFHANHLVFTPFGYLLYAGVAKLGLIVRAITVLQILNVFLNAAATFAFYQLANRLTGSRIAAYACAILFAFGATWWKFSTDADAYILCTLLLLLVYRLLLQNPPNLWGAGACHAAAMLFHELSVFMYVPVIAAIAFDARKTRAKRLWTAVNYSILTGLAVATPYFLCYEQVNHHVYPNLLAWITSYASDSGFTHSVGQVVNSYLTSYIKLFLGGKLSFIRDYFSIAICVGFAICAGALIWSVVQFRRTAEVPVFNPDRQAAGLLWVWLVSYAIFLGIWDPGSAFHKLFIWPAIILLVAIYAKPLRRHPPAFLGIAIAIAAWNFAAFIYPHAHDSADPVLTMAEQVNRELPKDATVYYRAFDPDDWYLDYFAPDRHWVPLPSNMADLKRNGTVCFETTALQELSSDFLFSKKWDLVNSRHNVRLECIEHPER